MIHEEVIETNKKYRVFDFIAGKWRRFSFWNKANDTECNDGTTVESKIGNIKGLTASMNVTETGFVPDAKTVSDKFYELNNNLTQYYVVNQTKISVQANTVITLSNLAAHESLAGKNILGVLPRRITAYSSDDFIPAMWYDDNSRIVRFSTTVSQDYSFEFIVVYK